jgi:hypothetical protein
LATNFTDPLSKESESIVLKYTLSGIIFWFNWEPINPPLYSDLMKPFGITIVDSISESINSSPESYLAAALTESWE